MVWISERSDLQKSFFIRIENRHERNLRQIQAFSQKIDPDQNVKFATAQVAKDLDPLERHECRCAGN